MDWYEPEVQALIKRLHESRLPERPVAFYGSSSIRLWTDLDTDLEDSRALNLGFGGSTLAACSHFFTRLVPPTGPASLVVYAGDNDLGDGRSADDVLRAFRTLADQVQASLTGVPFGFISIKLSVARTALREVIVEANSLIQKEIEKYPEAYYIDLFDALLDGSGQPRPELFLEDGLHLSRVGYEHWAKGLQPYRNRMFTQLLFPVVPNGLPSAIG